MGRRGAGVKSVREVMTSDVVTLGRESSVAAAMQAMLTHGITGVPVVEGRRVVGIITARDLLGQALYRLVGDVMTGEVATVSPETSMTDAYHLMETRDVARLPVVDDGRLVGLVSRPDILRELGKLTDPLTGLPWSGTLRQRAATLLAAGMEIVVLFIDLDRFRQVNKRFGHVAGDHLIIDAASVLNRVVDPALDLLCRYGGDEFAIVTTRGIAEAEALAEEIVRHLQELRVPGPEGFALGASIGLAGGRRLEERAAHPEATVDDLITMASRASTAAKRLERPILQAHQLRAMEALTQVLPEEELRLRLAGVRLTVEAERSSAVVELEHEGRRYRGTAEGSSIGHGPVRVLAQAAVSAVAQLLPPGWDAEVEEIAYTSFPLGDAVSVALALATPAGEELLMGTVPYAHTDASAVVRATLKAANRRLGRLLVLTHA